MIKTSCFNEAKRLATLHDYDVLDTAPEEAFDRITRVAQSALGMPIVLVSLLDADRQWFKSRQGLDVTETPREISFCTHAIEQDDPFIIPNALLDGRFCDNPLVTGEPNIRFYAGIPLNMNDGSKIGTLCAIDTQPREISDLEIGILYDLSRLVVDQMELRLLATTDSLTGALTRRSFEQELSTAFERAQRGRDSAAIITFDIDHFKTINDTFGHASGDAVLQNIAALCKSTLRPVDVFGRLGGEDFAILLPEIDRAGAQLVVEKLRSSFAANPVSAKRSVIAVTASFGMAVVSDQDRTPHDLLKRADEALHVAKQCGRNRAVFKDEDRIFSEVA